MGQEMLGCSRVQAAAAGPLTDSPNQWGITCSRELQGWATVCCRLPQSPGACTACQARRLRSPWFACCGGVGGRPPIRAPPARRGPRRVSRASPGVAGPAAGRPSARPRGAARLAPARSHKLPHALRVSMNTPGEASGRQAWGATGATDSPACTGPGCCWRPCDEPADMIVVRRGVPPAVHRPSRVLSGASSSGRAWRPSG